jgi:tRNA modification GTPase
LIEAADILLWLGDPGNAPSHPRIVQVQAKADLPERANAAASAIAVSSVTGAGITTLLERVAMLAESVLPGEGALAINRRQAFHLEEAAENLSAPLEDEVLIAENLRGARSAFDRLTGRTGVEDVLDALFSRFCLGK